MLCSWLAIKSISGLKTIAVHLMFYNWVLHHFINNSEVIVSPVKHINT